MKRVTSLVVALLVVAVSACEIKDASAPAPTGPSELGRSLSLFADPDVLQQDGTSQSRVTIEARDANSQPLRNVPVRVETYLAGVLADFGLLSARSVVTGSDGRASLIYTAPPPPSEPVDDFVVVTLLATPIGSNYANAIPRQVEIRLIPPGVILPPNTAPTAAFSFSPTTPGQQEQIVFDASSSTDPDGVLVSYQWDFGDQTTGSGVRVVKSYATGGAYTVRLTVTDDRNASNSTSQSVFVLNASPPTAAFTFSPTSPAVNEAVNFNASTSRAADGRTIVNYGWAFGDGGTGTGVVVTHHYATLGTFVATLTVTDDLGRTATITNTILVGTPTTPTASFVFSPLSPGVNQAVNFDASASRAPAGRTITSYEWNLGDGARATGVRVSHPYATAGLFTVQLRIVDSTGQFATVSQSVVVTSGSSPIASFTFSPTTPKAGDTISFNALGSRASTGRVITNYTWTFGDGVTGFGELTAHAYAATGTYTVTLTVRDDIGQSGTTSQTVVVSSATGPTATFIVSPASPTTNQPVNLDASQSTPTPGATIIRYEWNFGQGGPVPSTVTLPTTTTVYTVAGVYTILLRVVDSAGGSATSTQSVTVTTPDQRADQEALWLPIGARGTVIGWAGSPGNLAEAVEPGRRLIEV